MTPEAAVNGEVLDPPPRLPALLSARVHRAIADRVPLKGYCFGPSSTTTVGRRLPPAASGIIALDFKTQVRTPLLSAPLIRGRDAPPARSFLNWQSPHCLHATALQDCIPTLPSVGLGSPGHVGHWLYQSLAFHVFNIGLAAGPDLTALGGRSWVDGVGMRCSAGSDNKLALGAAPVLIGGGVLGHRPAADVRRGRGWTGNGVLLVLRLSPWCSTCR